VFNFTFIYNTIPQQTLYWQVPGYTRGPGQPRANWRCVVSKDLRKMGFTWEEAEVAALDRHGWRGPMCPVRCGINQGQGQGHTNVRELVRMEFMSSSELSSPMNVSSFFHFSK